MFILLELIETPETESLVSKQLKSQKQVLKAASKKNPKAKGLAVLLKKVEALPSLDQLQKKYERPAAKKMSALEELDE